MSIEYSVSELIQVGDHAVLTEAAMDRPEAFDDSHWMSAIKGGSPDVCKALVAAGLSPQWTRFPRAPLHFAASDGRLDIVRWLLALGADPNVHDSEGNTPLDMVYEFGEGSPPPGLVETLVEGGTAITIWTSVRMGDLERCKGLIEQAAHLRDAPSRCLGFTPLMVAARHNRIDIARLLLDVGADVNAESVRTRGGDGGNAPLWFAAQGTRPGRAAMVQLLLAHGASVNAPGEGGWTALHMAAQWNHPDVARILVERDADIGRKDSEGHTPLDIAEKHGSDLAVNLLTALT